MSSWLYAVESAGEKGKFFIDYEQLPRAQFVLYYYFCSEWIQQQKFSSYFDP